MPDSWSAQARSTVLATGPPICGALVGSTLCGPVTGTEVGGPVATAHAVNTATIKSKTIRLRQ